MKLLTFFILATLLTSNVTSQQNDITIFEKKDGNTNIVFARNTGKVSNIVTLTITAEGMTVEPNMKVEALVPSGHMKEMARITPIPGRSWSYGYEVAFMEYNGQNLELSAVHDASKDDEPTTITPPPSADVTLTDAAIVMYSKPGCSRCTMVKKELNARGITFEEFSTTSSSPEINHMWNALRDGGFTGDSVTMPVVRVNGKYHYNIKDLAGFVKGL